MICYKREIFALYTMEMVTASTIDIAQKTENCLLKFCMFSFFPFPYTYALSLNGITFP